MAIIVDLQSTVLGSRPSSSTKTQIWLEWPKTPVCKTGWRNPHVGSNPTICSISSSWCNGLACHPVTVEEEFESHGDGYILLRITTNVIIGSNPIFSANNWKISQMVKATVLNTVNQY